MFPSEKGPRGIGAFFVLRGLRNLPRRKTAAGTIRPQASPSQIPDAPAQLAEHDSLTRSVFIRRGYERLGRGEERATEQIADAGPVSEDGDDS